MHRFALPVTLLGCCLLVGCSQPLSPSSPSSATSSAVTLAFNFDSPAFSSLPSGIRAVAPTVLSDGQPLTFQNGQVSAAGTALPPLTPSSPSETVQLPPGTYSFSESAQNASGLELAWGEVSQQIQAAATVSPTLYPVIAKAVLSPAQGPYQTGQGVNLALTVFDAAGGVIPPVGGNYAVTYSATPSAAATLAPLGSGLSGAVASFSSPQSYLVSAAVTGTGANHQAADIFSAQAGPLAVSAPPLPKLPALQGTWNPSGTGVSEFAASSCTTQIEPTGFGSSNSISRVCLAGGTSHLYLAVQYDQSGNDLINYLSVGSTPSQAAVSLAGLSNYPTDTTYQAGLVPPSFFLVSGAHAATPGIYKISGTTATFQSGASIQVNSANGGYTLKAEVPYTTLGVSAGQALSFAGGVYGGGQNYAYGAGTIYPYTSSDGNGFDSSNNYAVTLASLLGYSVP